MPRHTRTLEHRERIARIIINLLEIHNPSIIIILPREQRKVEIGWMNVSQRMVVRIPSSKAEIETTNRSPMVIDNNNLLMMRPVADAVCDQRVSIKGPPKWSKV